MKRAIKIFMSVLALLVVAALGYGASGYWDAVRNSDQYAARADKLTADGRGPTALGPERLMELMLVQDPSYLEHRGVDLSTPGAGQTTITQSLSKRLGFDEFRPGVGKIRQTGFAYGLESQLSKDQIFALWLDTVEMGRGPNGWMTGFFHASESVYGVPPDELTDQEYHSLLAVLIAPGKFRLLSEDQELYERIRRIERLLAGQCGPEDHGDVWLDGCA